MICVLHYVTADDLGGVHNSQDAESGFSQFS